MTDPVVQICRTCGGGAPLDVHFCPGCTKILSLARHGDYFAFFGLPRKLELDAVELEQRFRSLSRQFHPDYFYNASPAERRASLERSSYLNDAYRTLKQPVARIEYLLELEGRPTGNVERPGQTGGKPGAKVPPALLEEVFALNEELDEVREMKAAGAVEGEWKARLQHARQPIDAKQAAHDQDLKSLSGKWDAAIDGGSPEAEKAAVLDALRDRMLERNYINNLLAGIERELNGRPDLEVWRESVGPSFSSGVNMSKVVGIDLGTTNSLVAYVANGKPVVIRDKSGDGLVPSVVSASAEGTIYVGREAQRRLLTDAGRTVYSVKRFMGKGPDDVKDEARLFPFEVLSGDGSSGVVRIGLGDQTFTPPEISAFILRELKHRAEEFFREQGEFDFEVERAVITVPAYFNDAQRTATRDAGRIAGLDVLRIINEPTAASLAYGLDKRDIGVVAVYDFGGGTFDISILRVEDGVFQVLATNGDTHLGGDDIDQLLIERVLADPALAKSGFSRTPEGIQEIRKAAIQAKIDLSDHTETEIRVGAFQSRITRTDLEQLIRPIVDRTLEPCRNALSDAGLDPSQVDEVVLVGGSTRIPLVRTLVGELFRRSPHSDLNPDEVVALGAAVQADNLVTGNRDMLLLDVTPLSLGIETMGGVTSKIILRNSTIPATGSEMFTTGVDNQTGVDIHVLQGERELVADNRSLARFKLHGVPPMPAGMPRVQVQFQIDANGILSVTASELRTGIEQSIKVTPSYGLTDDDVERMLVESFEHAEADFAARLLIEARNEAESVAMHTEKSLRVPEFAEIAKTDLAANEPERIRQALAGLKKVLNETDRDAIQQATHALNDATKHLAEVMMNRSVQAALTGKNVNQIG